MIGYSVIRVGFTTNRSKDERARITEIERYMYGRYFVLEVRTIPISKNSHEVFILVETHYADQIVPRLGSGLFGAKIVTELHYPEEAVR